MKKRQFRKLLKAERLNFPPRTIVVVAPGVAEGAVEVWPEVVRVVSYDNGRMVARRGSVKS